MVIYIFSGFVTFFCQTARVNRQIKTNSIGRNCSFVKNRATLVFNATNYAKSKIVQFLISFSIEHPMCNPMQNSI